MASPHVTGTAALFYSANVEDENGDGFINDEIRQLLQLTAIDLDEPGRDNQYGFGLVNASTVGLNCQLCQADVNRDGRVDIDDLIIIKEEYFRNDCATNPCQADCNGDGTVGISDLILVKAEFFKENCCVEN
jgi:hypothetical protein